MCRRIDELYDFCGHPGKSYIELCTDIKCDMQIKCYATEIVQDYCPGCWSKLGKDGNSENDDRGDDHVDEESSIENSFSDSSIWIDISVFQDEAHSIMRASTIKTPALIIMTRQRLVHRVMMTEITLPSVVRLM